MFSAHKYHSRDEFLRDVQLLVDNCRAYNGPTSQFTKQAETILKLTQESLEQVLLFTYKIPILLDICLTTGLIVTTTVLKSKNIESSRKFD